MTQEQAFQDQRADADAFQEAFGESLRDVLNLESWSLGTDLGEIYRRVNEEVQAAVAQEDAACAHIRKEIFPKLATYDSAPPGAGVYQAALADLERIHRGLLFSGGVEACDATVQHCDTLPLTLFQIGVVLVSYLGDQGTWSHRLFRRDLRASEGDPTEMMLKLLSRREQRDSQNHLDRDHLSRLARRGIMAYAERAILLRESQATWRMGHGNPAPLELLTGSHETELMIEATRIIRELVEGHQRFVFVASEPSDRVLLSIGQALNPLEYAIVWDLQDTIAKAVEKATFPYRVDVDTRWDGIRLSPDRWIRRFRDTIGPQVVQGVYRATSLAPAQVFYAHVDHAHLAAHIALADSLLQEHRGFPLLIDLADTVCRGMFGRDSFQGPVQTAYADAGVPWRYLSERASRYL
jgi:hypothetical protein